jgi:hypothetical protein
MFWTLVYLPSPGEANDCMVYLLRRNRGSLAKMLSLTTAGVSASPMYAPGFRVLLILFDYTS